MRNSFKKGIEPSKDAISQTIGRDAKPTRKLNPPVFEEELVDMRRKDIFWSQAIIKSEKRLF